MKKKSGGIITVVGVQASGPVLLIIGDSPLWLVIANRSENTNSLTLMNNSQHHFNSYDTAGRTVTHQPHVNGRVHRLSGDERGGGVLFAERWCGSGTRAC